MNNATLQGFRKIAETMNLTGNYDVVSYDARGRRIVHAFNLPKDRAENWAKYWVNAIVEKTN